MSYCLFLSLIFHWVMLFLGPSFGGISERQDWEGSQLPSHLLSHYVSLSAHLSLWPSLLPGVVVQQVYSELVMSQSLPAVILFTSRQLTKVRDFIIYCSPSHCWPCNPFYAKGWTHVFPDSDRPPHSVTPLWFVLTPSFPPLRTLVPGVMWLPSEELRLHCPLPTELPRA